MRMIKYQHIIWDWNGTLLDDAWLCLETINAMLQRRHLPAITTQHYEAIFGFPVLDYYKQLPFDLTLEPFEKISTEFVRAYEDRCTACHLRPGARTTLEEARRRGLRQTIISSSRQAYLEEAVAQLGVAHLFDGLHGLDDHHAGGKIGIAREWLKSEQINPAELLLVGDTLHDLEVAQALDVDCVLIFSGHQSRGRLIQGGATVIDNLTDLFA